MVDFVLKIKNSQSTVVENEWKSIFLILADDLECEDENEFCENVGVNSEITGLKWIGWNNIPKRYYFMVYEYVFSFLAQ